MKANRKFLYDEEAVSPVIAVILMVAITVVLAATVFVLVSDIGSKTQKNAPQIGWADDEVGDKMTVSQAPAQVFWHDMQIKMTVAGKFAKNAAATSASTGLLTANTYAAVEASTLSTTVTGGDYLAVCGTS